MSSFKKKENDLVQLNKPKDGEKDMRVSIGQGEFITALDEASGGVYALVDNRVAVNDGELLDGIKAVRDHIIDDEKRIDDLEKKDIEQDGRLDNLEKCCDDVKVEITNKVDIIPMSYWTVTNLEAVPWEVENPALQIINKFCWWNARFKPNGDGEWPNDSYFDIKGFNNEDIKQSTQAILYGTNGLYTGEITITYHFDDTIPPVIGTDGTSGRNGLIQRWIADNDRELKLKVNITEMSQWVRLNLGEIAWEESNPALQIINAFKTQNIYTTNDLGDQIWPDDNYFECRVAPNTTISKDTTQMVLYGTNGKYRGEVTVTFKFVDTIKPSIGNTNLTGRNGYIQRLIDNKADKGDVVDEPFIKDAQGNWAYTGTEFLAMNGKLLSALGDPITGGGAVPKHLLDELQQTLTLIIQAKEDTALHNQDITNINNTISGLDTIIQQKEQTLTAGTNITIDRSNPISPVISATNSTPPYVDPNWDENGNAKRSLNMGGMRMDTNLQPIRDTEFVSKSYVDSQVKVPNDKNTEQDTRLNNDEAILNSKADKSYVDEEDNSIKVQHQNDFTLLQNQIGTKTDKSYVDSQDNKKQDKLVSGTNIKSINGASILGSGNMNISSGFSGYIDSDYTKNFDTPNGRQLILVDSQVLTTNNLLPFFDPKSFQHNTDNNTITDNFIQDSNGFRLRKPAILDQQQNRIVNLDDPLDPQDAVTKKYVDSNTGGWIEGEYKWMDKSITTMPSGWKKIPTSYHGLTQNPYSASADWNVIQKGTGENSPTIIGNTQVFSDYYTLKESTLWQYDPNNKFN